MGRGENISARRTAAGRIPTRRSGAQALVLVVFPGTITGIRPGLPTRNCGPRERSTSLRWTRIEIDERERAVLDAIRVARRYALQRSWRLRACCLGPSRQSWMCDDVGAELQQLHDLGVALKAPRTTVRMIQRHVARDERKPLHDEVRVVRQANSKPLYLCDQEQYAEIRELMTGVREHERAACPANSVVGSGAIAPSGLARSAAIARQARHGGLRTRRSFVAATHHHDQLV